LARARTVRVSMDSPASPRPHGVTGPVSTALFAALHLSVLLVFWVHFSGSLLLLCAASYCLRMWAITAGFHRYFAHRAFKTSRPFQFVLALLATTAVQNGPLWWASWHRRHHRHSDAQGDAHSPVRGGFFHAHAGWFLDGSHDAPNLANVRDLARYPELRWLDRHKWLPIVAYALAMYFIAGFAGFVWGFAVSTVLSLHATMCINSLAHMWGSRRYATADASRNNPVLALFTFGEGWHNNHHFDMNAARQGRTFWELDITYLTLRLLATVGLVWDLRPPAVPRVSRRRGTVPARGVALGTTPTKAVVGA